jgi:hypothetical protein
VPAAAVIPAPIAYIKVVAVKKLVVGFLAGPLTGTESLSGRRPGSTVRPFTSRRHGVPLTGCFVSSGLLL